MVFAGFSNLPASYKSASGSFDLNGGFDYSPLDIQVFSGSLQDMATGYAVTTTLQNVADVFSGTALAGRADYTSIENDSFELLTKVGVGKANFSKGCTTLKSSRSNLKDGSYRIKSTDGTVSTAYCPMESGT